MLAFSIAFLTLTNFSAALSPVRDTGRLNMGDSSIAGKVSDVFARFCDRTLSAKFSAIGINSIPAVANFFTQL